MLSGMYAAPERGKPNAVRHVPTDMRLLALALLVAVACTCQAGAAPPVRVSVAGTLTSPVAGRAWTVRLTVRPASFAGGVRVRAIGPRVLGARATGGRGAYRARLVFPSAGRWP